MFEEYEIVKLRTSLSEAPVPVGAKGTILMVYTQPRLAYEVEFFSKSGKSFGAFTVEGSQIESWQPAIAFGKRDS